MKSIRSLIAEEATVIRDGERRTIPSVDIVAGDIVLLSLVSFYPLVLLIIIILKPNSKGNRVPADIRIVEASSDLRFDRSLLTGERLVIVPYLILWGPYSHLRQVI